MADGNKQPSDHGTRQRNDHTPGLRDERNVKPSKRRERALLRAEKKLPERPDLFWVTVVVLLNILVFTGLGYMLWTS